MNWTLRRRTRWRVTSRNRASRPGSHLKVRLMAHADMTAQSWLCWAPCLQLLLWPLCFCPRPRSLVSAGSQGDLPKQARAACSPNPECPQCHPTRRAPWIPPRTLGPLPCHSGPSPAAVEGAASQPLPASLSGLPLHCVSSSDLKCCSECLSHLLWVRELRDHSFSPSAESSARHRGSAR